MSNYVNMQQFIQLGFQVRTERALFPRYERERFSGGVNLSAMDRNAEIDKKCYRFRNCFILSPRALAALKAHVGN